MSSINDGGPAFPVADYDHQTFSPGTVDEERRLLSGMSLRDYFAAKALQGQLSAQDDAGFGVYSDFNVLATQAYEIADAMLKAREVTR